MCSICNGSRLVDVLTEFLSREYKLIKEFFILCNDIFPFIAHLRQKGIGKFFFKVPHAVVNLQNVTGEPVKKVKLRNGICINCYDRKKYGEIANDHAGKDGWFHTFFSVTHSYVV